MPTMTPFQLAALTLTVLTVSGADHDGSKGVRVGDPMSWTYRPVLKRGSLADLLPVDAEGGRFVSIADFDLSKPGIRVQTNVMGFCHETLEGMERGCYRLRFRTNDPGYAVVMSQATFRPKPNRHYKISALVNVRFTRNDPRPGGEATELMLGIFDSRDNGTDPFNKDRPISLAAWNGLPDNSGGWVRWEHTFPSYALPGDAAFWMRAFHLRDVDFRIADFQVVELPERELVPFKQGEGVQFRGGVGRLPMAVEKVVPAPDKITVLTTGAAYEFDLVGNTLSAAQRIEKQRPIAVCQFSAPLKGLRVLKQDPLVCVLANDAVTFGVQCDGLVMISPQTELDLDVTSRIGGQWNRLIAGHLYAGDAWGGFTVNPAIPLGSGRPPRVEVKTPHLDFIGKVNDTVFVSQAQPGWQMRWQVSPGERIALTTFPPRPYDWEKSFDFRARLTFRGQPVSLYRDQLKGYFNQCILWDFTQRGYGMQWGPRALPVDEAALTEHIRAVHDNGMKALNYFSQYFYYSRDAQEWINELKRWKDTYGIDGFYSDGNPDREWIVAYEEMRMAREVFPNGFIMLHTTGQSVNGGPPLALPDISLPCIDTYTDATVKHEWIAARGTDYAYPKLVSRQFRVANCFGVTKGDRWELDRSQQDSLTFCYNGRPWADDMKMETWKNVWHGRLNEMKELWRQHGTEPDFYARFFRPKAVELTGCAVEERD